MSHAFLFEPEDRPAPAPKRRKVFVTGAGGRIGSHFAEHAHQRYDLTLMVQRPEQASRVERFGEVVVADLAEAERLKTLLAGMDTVLHLAGDPRAHAPWASLLPTNIEGTYHLLEAAAVAGCRRVIFASSVHAISGDEREVQAKPGDPVSPGDLYGVSKCFGEALGRYYATQRGLQFIAVRIGAFKSLETARQPRAVGMINTFVSPRDLQQLFERCIDDERLRFAIVHGLSRNAFNRMDTSETRQVLQYQPVDDFAELHPLLDPLDLAQHVRPHSETGGGTPG